ncbi:glycoside hydrolase superfamily, partial [Cladorrhinum sp. PSN259]
FNPRSVSNVVVYYGQSEATTRISLGTLCEDPNVDIMVLGFITAITAEGSNYPRLQLQSPIPGVLTPLMAVQATGLLYYASLETDIQTCQSRYGKKILLSIGGATSNLVLRNDAHAIAFANTLWALFGPTGYVPNGLRPFGQAVVDGFDLDKNDGQPAFFGTFATALRASFGVDLTKDYFLSAAPQCIYPDPSVPQNYLSQCNFVWPQFFNNLACEVGSAGFLDSVFQWSRTLGDGIVPMRDSSAFRTRLLIGIPGWLQAAPLTFVKLGGVRGVQLLATQLRQLTGLVNLGGLMIWDGPQGLENIADGLSILGWAKSGLRG